MTKEDFESSNVFSMKLLQNKISSKLTEEQKLLRIKHVHSSFPRCIPVPKILLLWGGKLAGERWGQPDPMGQGTEECRRPCQG